jgi:Transposase DDE domain
LILAQDVAMAGKKRKRVRSDDVQGLTYFERMQPLLKRLHKVGCERDKAGNRQLHYDEYCMLVLLYLFNPICSSLRALQEASQLEKVQKWLKVPASSLGSLSEAVQVFDPELLKPILEELGDQLQPVVQEHRLRDVKQLLTIVDGTLLRALPQITAAAWQGQPYKSRSDAWRLHTHFEVQRHVPVEMTLTTGRNQGEAHERHVLKGQLKPDHCYLMDRGYTSWDLFNQIVEVGSSYVCRIYDDAVWKLEQERPLSAEAQQAGVLADKVVTLGADRTKRPEHLVRLVSIKATPHRKRSGHHGNAGPSNNGTLLIATNLLDVPAEIVALLYQYRWTIEVFFRFFKHVLGCRHLLSQDEAGIQIQTYCAIIACLLISLYTGRKPTLRTYRMLSFYLMGWASEEELGRHLKLAMQTA